MEDLQQKSTDKNLLDAHENDIVLYNDAEMREFAEQQYGDEAFTTDADDFVHWSNDDYIKWRQEKAMRKRKAEKEDERHRSYRDDTYHAHPYFDENGQIPENEMVKNDEGVYEPKYKPKNGAFTMGALGAAMLAFTLF